jgi:hypothetical protein
MLEAIDRHGRELVAGDIVITQGRLAMFSHCTEKRMMVMYPTAWGRTPYQLIQRQRHDMQKFVPELETDFRQKMEESIADHEQWKKENAS